LFKIFSAELKDGKCKDNEEDIDTGQRNDKQKKNDSSVQILNETLSDS
jgi:hypothetical protein